MQGFLQTLLTNPNQDLDAYLESIQGFWDSLRHQLSARARDSPYTDAPRRRSDRMAATTERRRRPQAPAALLSLLTRQDKIVLGLAVGIPAFIHIFLVWVPTISLDHPVVHDLERDRRARQIKFVGSRTT